MLASFFPTNEFIMQNWSVFFPLIKFNCVEYVYFFFYLLLSLG